MSLVCEMGALESLISNPPETSRIVKFTPEMCETILVLHRPKRQRETKAKKLVFSRAMFKGQWGLTGDTIKFGRSGALIDGQNRLLACIKAGVPFLSHVVFGIDDVLFDRLDQGTKRSKEDVFTIDGLPHGNVMAKATSWAEKIELNEPQNRQAFEPYELLATFYEKYEDDLPPRVEDAIAASRVNKYPEGTLAALFYHFHRVDPDNYRSFLEQWMDTTRIGRKPATAVDALFARLRKHRQDGFRPLDIQFVGWAIEAWRAHCWGVMPKWDWSASARTYPSLDPELEPSSEQHDPGSPLSVAPPSS